MKMFKQIEPEVHLSSFTYKIDTFTHNQPKQSTSKNCSLAWCNLRYEVRDFYQWTNLFNSSKNKIILQRLTGHVLQGSLNGFMGPSGAGKTTLLNCLNGNLRKLASGSELYVSSDEQSIPSIGFVEQHVHETIVGGLTVREILYYAFRFKNQNNDIDKLDEHINITLKQLLLDSDVLSNHFEKCSGGEQKRIAIAQEMMSLKKPSFLFIDEPTTGLDSQAALIVMQCLRRLATGQQMTLLVSIHSPNNEIINMIDQLYILAKGGVCIYAGRPDLLEQHYIEEIGIEIEDDQSPIEEYLKLACRGIEDNDVMKMARKTLINENDKLKPFQNSLRNLPFGMPRQYKSFSISDLFIQLNRLGYIILWIDVRKILFQLLCYILFYLFMATVFDHRIITESNMCFPIDGGNETCSEETQRHGWANSYVNYQAHSVMFFSVLNIVIGSVLFIPLLKVFRNEHRNRWYSMTTFYWSFIWIRFVEMTMFSLVIAILMYFPTRTPYIDDNQMNWQRFGSFVLFIWLMSFYMQSSGQLLCLVFGENLELSVMGSTLMSVQYILASNYILNLAHMNLPLLNMLSDVLATKFITNGMLFTFFQFQRCHPTLETNQKTIDFHIDHDTVFFDCWHVLLNILILHATTFTLMYLRYSWISIQKKISTANISQQNSDWTPIGIDIENDSRKSSSFSMTNPQLNINISGVHRKKSRQEIQFEEFSRERVIVAWRRLNLFGTKSIREIRSLENYDEKSKLILRDLSGQFLFGTLNALMGTSGSGKTSLLKVLNGRSKTRLSNESEIYLSRFTPTRICYLTQEVSGHLWPGLTAKQSLIYASKLKNGFELENQVNHEKVANNLLEQLDLMSTADTFVQLCSGGERKRLALALELTSVRMPNLICIDEPTSGLDSNSAEIVIRCLKRLITRHNITIVASIHQPTTEILMLFDNCYVLARGGVCIYSGHPRLISKHLSQVPEIKWTPQSGKFPVEELIKWSCLNDTNSVVDKLTQITKEKILSRNLEEDTQRVLDGIQENRIPFSMNSVWLLCCRYGQYILNYHWPFLLTPYLFYISLAITNRMFYNDKIAQTSGCVSLNEDFQNICNRTEKQMQLEIDLTSNTRYTFFSHSVLAFAIMLNTGLNLFKDSRFFFNEHRNGWYSTGVYYLMKSLYDIIPVIPIIMIFVWILDIYESVRPGIYWWMFMLYIIAVISLQGVAHLLTLLSSNPSQGGNKGQSSWQTITLVIILIGYVFLMNMLSNFFNPLSTLHYVYQLVSIFNTARWLQEGLMILQYGFDRCGPKQVQLVLYVMRIQHDEHFYTCVRMLICNMILYRTLAMLVLMCKSNPVKNRRRRAERILNYYNKELKLPTNPSIIPGLANTDTWFHIKQIKIENNSC